MTNGLLYKADCEEDIDLFLNYITFKKGQKKNPFFKIQLLEPIKKGIFKLPNKIILISYSIKTKTKF